ncbi:SDR family oxidoreductase [Thermoflavimicrobium daqui]|uniref:Short-chain dehydrogenase n=1 Tax=Thermoflavimicrobium daqui TaxID=2137476 RepID=A0A364K7C2_9BACL|nr:SDR family oxidoreductase [Thermoflavimicrobium daqui]RAL26196.1 short-chain dehydrogenase [Thermoflavimicrobium daqui]
MLNQEKQHENKQKKYKCYVCKQPILVKHPHYQKLCYECGEFNEKKRLAKHNLSAYIALVTGGRTKIGYYTALRLLRDGARVIVTSRFPYNALLSYIQEPDFEMWKDRIQIYGLDFRQLDKVEKFTYFLDQHFPYIDIIINNAAQTVRMSDEEYHALSLNELELQKQLTSSQILQLTADEIPVSEFEDSNIISSEFQSLQLFNREVELMSQCSPQQNSWIAQPHQISVVEMLEVQVINVTAPFMINTKLKSAMLRSPNRNRFIINVSSAEGKFNMKRKGSYHVHTNMAKASLNMMTLTMSKEYKKDRIFMTSVDPGWVSNQIPEEAKSKTKIQLPLDFHDAAARICDPIYEGKDVEKPHTGVFFKDYQVVDW